MPQGLSTSTFPFIGGWLLKLRQLFPILPNGHGISCHCRNGGRLGFSGTPAGKPLCKELGISVVCDRFSRLGH